MVAPAHPEYSWSRVPADRPNLVPQRAVFEIEDLPCVAVVGPDNRADIRTVRTGEQVGILVEGFENVESGMVVRPKPPQAEPVLGHRATGGGD